MNPTRAPAFVHNSNSRLEIDPHWPELPEDITFFCVSGSALDSRGYLYVIHRGDNPFLRFNPDGSFDREIGADVQKKSIGYNLMGEKPVAMDLRHWLHCVHVDPWDNVWITDVGRHLIMRFDPEGNLTKTLGVEGVSGCDATHFHQPTHVCVMPSGEYFVSDGYGNSRVIKFSADDKMLMQWGSRGTAIGEFHTPHIITHDEDGRLYISDRENDRVLVYDQAGQCLAEWPGLHSVDGLDYAPDGSIYGGAGLDGAIPPIRSTRATPRRLGRARTTRLSPRRHRRTRWHTLHFGNQQQPPSASQDSNSLTTKRTKPHEWKTD